MNIMRQRVDEETPLLREQTQETQHPERQRTPLPWRQYSILWFIQIAEPLTFQIISPFLPELIKDIGITEGKESRVGYYVGLLHSLFFFTEACTIFHWSRMSDQIGRRPVVLIGLFGLSISMWCFGLSKTFWGLVVSRCLSGALNGNSGVMKSAIVEITDETNVAQAFGMSPIAWSLGATVGPLIGGSLAKPAERFPEIFSGSSFFEKYPYFLPCSIAASFSALSCLLVLSFLRETSNPPMSLKQYFFGGPTKGSVISDGSNESEEHHSLRSLLIRPVLVAAGSYAMFALTDIAFRAIMPVFYAMPLEMGGLDLDPPTIGFILATLGVSGGIIQMVCFAPMFNWLGAKPTYFICVSMCIPAILLFPAINTAARAFGFGTFVWFLVALQLVLYIVAGFAFSVTSVYVGASAPNRASIGATNGIAQLAVSVTRGLGPAAVNSAFSYSVEENVMGGNFVYVVMMVLVGLTLCVGFFLPKTHHQQKKDN